MVGRQQRAHEQENIWPSFVDLLSNIIIVLIFVLLFFILFQLYLGEALSGRDNQLSNLQKQLSSLADSLALEKASTAKLGAEVQDLKSRLVSTLADKEELQSLLTSTLAEEEDLKFRLASILAEEKELKSRLASTLAEKEKLQGDLKQQKTELSTLGRQYEQEKTSLQEKISNIESEKLLQEEEEIRLREGLYEESELKQQALEEIRLLNLQIEELNLQLKVLNVALEASESREAKNKIEIEDLGNRLNKVLASRVKELHGYRSIFLGELRKILSNRDDILVVGDRFVFSSEIFFDAGSAELSELGRVQLSKIARSIIELEDKIPQTIPWLLLVEGHTDNIPIASQLYPSNWELSMSRALSVCAFLISQGVHSERLGAAGYSQFQPIAANDTIENRKRNRRIELKLTQR